MDIDSEPVDGNLPMSRQMYAVHSKNMINTVEPLVEHGTSHVCIGLSRAIHFGWMDDKSLQRGSFPRVIVVGGVTGVSGDHGCLLPGRLPALLTCMLGDCANAMTFAPR